MRLQHRIGSVDLSQICPVLTAQRGRPTCYDRDNELL